MYKVTYKVIHIGERKFESRDRKTKHKGLIFKGVIGAIQTAVFSSVLSIQIFASVNVLLNFFYWSFFDFITFLSGLSYKNNRLCCGYISHWVSFGAITTSGRCFFCSIFIEEKITTVNKSNGEQLPSSLSVKV